MRVILLIGLLAGISNAIADDYFMDASIAAYHYDRDLVKEKNLNETNYGIGIESKHMMAGFYYNSERKYSVYVLGYLPVIDSGGFSAGVLGGGLTGYRYAVIPAAGLRASYVYKGVGINLLATPNIPSQRVYGFFGLQLKKEF